MFTRLYHERKETALRKLQSFARGYIARRECRRLAQEKFSAIIVQCAYRSRKARLAAAYKRVIRQDIHTYIPVITYNWFGIYNF